MDSPRGQISRRLESHGVDQIDLPVNLNSHNYSRLLYNTILHVGDDDRVDEHASGWAIWTCTLGTLDTATPSMQSSEALSKASIFLTQRNGHCVCM